MKWGARQHCKPGDWLVQNGDDTYTVDAEVFSRTYRPVGGNEYQKVATMRPWPAGPDARPAVSRETWKCRTQPIFLA